MYNGEHTVHEGMYMFQALQIIFLALAGSNFHRPTYFVSLQLPQRFQVFVFLPFHQQLLALAVDVFVVFKVIIEKSRGEGSLMEQDTIVKCF